MTWDGAAIGRILGPAGARETHKRVLKAALSMLAHDMPPGRVVAAQV
jgi:hypothetical protein